VYRTVGVGWALTLASVNAVGWATVSVSGAHSAARRMIVKIVDATLAALGGAASGEA